LRAEYSKHLAFVQRERRAYKICKNLAKQHPDKYLSVVIDGADQAKYKLPYAREKSKETGTHKIKSHVFGLMAHGRGVHMTTTTDSCKLGHNSTIDLLHRFLMFEKKRGATIPKTLFLQLDNTTKQNKGKYLYSYLALLVELHVFDNVYINFLPVGHTHVDVDQVFSRLSTVLHGRDAWDYDAIHEAARQIDVSNIDGKTLGGVIQTHHLETIANFSDWTDKGKTDQEAFKGITKWNAFKIHRKAGTKGRAVVQAKPWPGDSKQDWQRLDGKGCTGSYSLVFDQDFDPLSTKFLPQDLPPAQRTDIWDEDYAQKVYKLLDGLKKTYKIPSACIENLHKEVKLCMAPENEPSKCTWNLADHNEVVGMYTDQQIKNWREECFAMECGITALRSTESAGQTRTPAAAASRSVSGSASLSESTSNAHYETECSGEDGKGRIIKRDEWYLCRPINHKDLVTEGEAKYLVVKVREPEMRTWSGDSIEYRGGYVDCYDCLDKNNFLSDMVQARRPGRGRIVDMDYIFSSEMIMKLTPLAKGSTSNTFRFHKNDHAKITQLVETWITKEQQKNKA
jgi:hypothetical protein